MMVENLLKNLGSNQAFFGSSLLHFSNRKVKGEGAARATGSFQSLGERRFIFIYLFVCLFIYLFIE